MGEILFTEPCVQQSTKTTSYKRQVLGNPLDEPHVFFNLLLIQLHRKLKHSESRSLFNMQGCEISTGHSHAHRQLFVIEVHFLSARVLWHASPAFRLVLISIIPPLPHSSNSLAHVAATSQRSQCEKHANHAIICYVSVGVAFITKNSSHAWWMYKVLLQWFLQHGDSVCWILPKTSVSGPFQHGLNWHRPELQVVCSSWDKKWPLSALVLWCFFFFFLVFGTNMGSKRQEKLWEVYSALSNKVHFISLQGPSR